MALKRPFQSLETFSMSSMTDIIFLLLIFFMVTSTIIFPAAIEVNLPQSAQQTSEKPITEVYVDSVARYYFVEDRNAEIDSVATPRVVTLEELGLELTRVQQADSTRAIALYADSIVDYGKVVEVLDMAARRNIHLILATRATQAPEPIAE